MTAVGATYCPQDERIYDDVHRKGVRIVNFSPVLKYGLFPLPDLLSETLSIGRYGMGCAVEVEFAVNLESNQEDPRPENFLLATAFHSERRLRGRDPCFLLSFFRMLRILRISEDVEDVRGF